MMLVNGMAIGQREGTQPDPGASSQHVTVGGNVFGGGNKAAVKGSCTVLVNQQGAVIGTVNNQGTWVSGGDVYGGGALANVNVTETDNGGTITYSHTPNAITKVDILDGKIYGNVYGGGLGDSVQTCYGGTQEIAALVYGKVYVNIGAPPTGSSTNPIGNATFNGGVFGNGSVFGCNNINGTPLDSVFVHVYKTGHTDINRYPDTITTTNFEDMEKLRTAAITANAEANYAIQNVYGGGNKASYKPELNTTGNTPKCTTVHIHYCEENTIKTVYGGGNAADAGTDAKPANTHLIIDGGRFDRIFGGGNGYSQTGNHDDCTQDYYNPGANIYGSATTDFNGGLCNQIFGGSNQYGNIATASLNINNSSCIEMILESFCGGNEANMVGGDINATISNCDIRIGTLYGGSNKAHILKDNVGNGGNVTLTVLGGNYDYVFGGSKGVSGTPANIAGNVTLNLHGGKIVDAFGGSDVNGNILGNITVNVLDTIPEPCNLQVDTVYGAGRDAAYTPTDPNAVSPLVKIQHATIGHGTGSTAVPGCVFGGGKGSTATVTAHPYVIIGELNTINDPHNEPIDTQATVTGDVYGGGNAAAVVGGTTVLVQKCNSYAKYVYGGGNAADVDSTKVYITGGTIDTLFGGGHGSITPEVSADVTYHDTISITSGTIGKAFSGSNLNGSIGGRMALNIDKIPGACDLKIGEVYGGGNMAAGKAGAITIGCTGTWTTGEGNTHEHHNNTTNRIGYELEGIGTVYGGANQAHIGTSATPSNITLNINSGMVDNVFGGNNTSGDIYGTIEVNIEKTNESNTCAWYVGNVYGGGNLAQYTSPNDNQGNPTYPRVNILNGTVSQNVYGGGKGDPDDHSKGQVTGSPVVTIGDLTVGHESYVATVMGDVYGGGDAGDVDGTPEVTVVNKCSTSVGYVYGGGNAADVGGTDVTIDGGTIVHDVFGGGHGDKADLGPGHSDKVANVNGNASVIITGGTIDRVFAGSNINGTISGTNNVLSINKSATAVCDMKIHEVYGGGNMAAGNATSISVGCTGALVSGDSGHAAHPENIGISLEGIGSVYGGANQANIGTSENHSDITLNINSGMVGNVYGGNNISGTIYGDIEVNIEKTSDACGWYVGNVYGGGNLAQYTGGPAVNVYNGTVSGNVYGGGKGLASDHSKGQVTGNPVVTIGDNSSGHGSYEAIVSGSVFGGGDAGNVEGTPVVNVVEKCNTTITTAVYGGGNAADVSATNVTINGGTIGDVFGGGNGAVAAANVAGATGLAIHGGTINRVFAGGNTSGTIGTNSGVTIDHTSSCNQSINEVYGGGNLAAGNAGTIAIGCTAVNIGDVYGGANKANITNNIELIITGGQINNVYGGNNTSGEIPGTIKVKVNKDSSCSNFSLGNVFGGGNMAVYSGTPEVKIINGTVSGNVFGGGNKAGVAGSNVEMTGGVVLTGVYGGCNESGTVTGTSLVKIYGGDVGSSELLNATIPVVAQVFGGGLGEATRVNGDVEVNIGDATHAPSIYGDVYGGSALGQVNDAASDETTVNILNGTLYTHQTTVNNFPVYNGGNVYGGGLGQSGVANVTKGQVNGTVTVNIGTGTVATSGQYAGFTTGDNTGNATIQGNVYGCNNTNGSPQESVTVNIFKTAHNEGANGYALNNVFGGGNQANFQVTGKTATVNIYGCDNTIRRTFGGGNAAATNAVTTMVQGGHINEAYAGGNGEVSAANVNGNVALYIHGGNVDHTFAGSNQQGTITGSSTVTVDGASPCDDPIIDELFMGGNYANWVGDINATVTCAEGMQVRSLYGGCKQANVVPADSEHPGNVHLIVYGGTYHYIYGGSQGTEETPADIAGNVTLDIHGCTLTNTIFGDNETPAIFGGSHINGNIGGKIVVTVDYDPNNPCALDVSKADVYGGGNRADYTAPNVDNHNYPEVNIKRATVLDVFGGGLEAKVTGNPQVKIKKHAKVLGNVYGGGNMGVVDGNPKVIVNGKDE